MNEQEEKILAILNRNKQPETQVETTQTEEAPEAVPSNEPTQEATIVETENPANEQLSPEQEETPVSWDDTPEVKVETSSPQIDFSELGSALELGEVKTREEFIAKTSELKSKLKTLQENPLAGVPEDLREVLKVAENGDWKEYLATQLIDYSQLDPIVEFEDDFRFRSQKNPKYFTDGKFDPQKVEEALDTMPEAVRETYGVQLLQAKASQQQRHREQLKAKAEAKRAEADRNLSSAAKNLGELLPVEQYGIKFEPKHSSEMYEGITNSKLTKKHLGLSYEDLVRSGADMKSVVRSITLAEKGEKMISFKSNKTKVEAQKSLLNKIQNVQLNTTGTNPTPENPEDKVKSPAEKIRELRLSQHKGL